MQSERRWSLFTECPITRGSMPNLRSDSVSGENSGDSTESLIDEAEDYLRRSIDSMLTISSTNVYFSNKQTSRRRRVRRHSEPELIRDWVPPQDAKPYLPKVSVISVFVSRKRILLRLNSTSSYCSNFICRYQKILS